jgi:hypothetical protein
MSNGPQSSVLFNPPQNSVPDSDPSIVRIPLKQMDWAARSSQQKPWDKDIGGVKNLPNGK